MLKILSRYSERTTYHMGKRGTSETAMCSDRLTGKSYYIPMKLPLYDKETIEAVGKRGTSETAMCSRREGSTGEALWGEGSGERGMGPNVVMIMSWGELSQGLCNKSTRKDQIRPHRSAN